MDVSQCYEAGKTAAEQWTEGPLGSAAPLRRELKSNLKQLQRRIRQKGGGVPSPGDPDRWLLENQYLVELAAQSAGEGLQSVGKLPFLNSEPAEARVLALARSLMEQPELLTQPEVVSFLKGAQSITPLLERELRVLLVALEYVSVEQLASLLRAPEATREEGFSRLFAHLRRWNDLDFQMISEQASQVHGAFLADPTGDYGRMPPRDRAMYRQRLETMARRAQSPEVDYARALVARAGTEHIGFLLFGRDPVPFRVIQRCYFPTLALVSLLMALGLGFYMGVSWSFVLFWLPLFGMWKAVADWILLRIVPRRPVFRLSLAGGLTRGERTLVVKTTILTGEDSLAELRQLECIYLANRDCGKELSLGLLADFPERSTPVNAQDRVLLQRLESALNQLNRRYGGQFFLFVRTPVYQQSQGTFGGWERKRGALLELARMLRSRRSSIEVYSGDRTRLHGVRYLVTLDSDTNPGVGGIRPLVGAMCHPLNRPELDATRGVVSKGYGILQPQIRTALSDARSTAFARLFSGGAGTDPYRGTGSELYHDLFDESSFCGKGILDLDCFLACLDGRIPEQRVLSHDILEGAFLRTGCLSQISFNDGFPGTVKGFFKRQHRWVRGDWQNLPWIFSSIPTAAGREPNPLSDISRWKLADNLRRSLTPVVQLICLTLGVMVGGKLAWFAWIALGSLALEPLLGLAGSLLGTRSVRHFHSRIWSGFGQTVLQVSVKLALLPLVAWTNASALWLALWRSLISHKNMLQWTTFAQQRTGRGGILSSSLPMLVSGLLLGAVSLLLRRPLGLLPAALWLLAPLIVAALDRGPSSPGLQPREQAFLLHEAELIWGFFADFLKPERNFLPPDNYQLRPYQGPAERTSPTNIGFAALSCLAAVDLGLEPEDQVLERIAGLLDTLERMEKWRGNLYNWYHTVTLEPMAPKVVSSVDSGNLCGCLLALSTGLKELGREDLSERALRLARETDLGALYDSEKHLFYISYEPDTDTWSGAHYDLMASEARLLSYVALGLGQVEHRHWAALSRAQAAAKGYQGMVSWFGTMFEYFMPHLLLPLPEDSFLYESLAFCACEQLRFGRERGIPWGISESALPTLDQNGCYSYRANGVPSIALCHMPEREPVVAPYATYLTLSLLPHRAVDNLRRLRQDGLEGKYGLYEAAEYGHQGIAAAKSWMSHHMGMSLVAIDNALRKQIQVRRLMALPEMEAVQPLLEEAVPRAATPLQRKSGRPAPERQGKAPSGWRLEGRGVSEEKPVCVLLPGRELSAVVTNSGYCWLTGPGESLTARRMPPALYLERRGTVLPLFPSPPGAHSVWSLGERECVFKLEAGDVQAKLTMQSTEMGALRWTLELSDVGEGSTLFFTLCPQLASERDFLAHPAFSLLRLEAEHTAGRVVFRRRGREGSHSALCCQWPGRGSIKSFTGPEATARMARLGLPAEEPCLLLEMPVTGVGARMTFQMDTGPAVGPWQPLQSQPELLDLLSRLLPELVFAPLLGQAGQPGPQRLLWRLGISGDDPLVLSGLPKEKNSALLLIQAWERLRTGGIPFDLAFWGPEDRREQLQHWVEEMGLGLGGHSGVHFVQDSQDNRALLRGMACADLDCLPERETQFPTTDRAYGWPVPCPGSAQVKWQRDSVTLRGKLPPVRWSIPLTNGKFGYLALDTGGGYLWCQNARLFRITPWDNNPRGMGGPEELLVSVQDKQYSLFAGGDELPWSVTFGQGFLRWEKEFDGAFRTTVTAFVPPDRNERVFLLEVQNPPPEAALVWRLKPQMGEYVSQSLWATAQVSEGRVWLSNPVTQRSGICLSASAPWKDLRLPEGRRRGVELTFDLRDTLVLQIGQPCSALTPEQAGKRLAETIETWRDRCGRLQVETPDPALNHYLSFWGQYQVQASRMLARTSVYQCGGAYGFRDQLQDCCALIQTNPPQVREHILRCCRHQFIEGDVLHWWHEMPEGGADAGVRTRISDDLLWLPYALSVWWEETGERELLEQSAPYLTGQRLGPEEHDRYFAPELGSETESVYRHGIRALECVLGRGVGKHGLCKMGSGDWNDGMDRVGAGGQGESVWLTWFAALVLRRFATVCEAFGERERCCRYRETADRLVEAAGRCWDGNWFLRGFFDSGEALGSNTCPEGQIDSISQSFAALVCEDQTKARRALEYAEQLLADWNSGTVALLSPPFDGKGPNPGYVADYRPGNRENGGQYTHGAVWLALAWFHLGEPDRGWRVLKHLLPEHHPLEQYQGEPFVLAADVCREPGKEGAAGWTWYTGAAGWYWRVAVQQLLGICFRGGLLYLEPHLPRAWPGYRAKLRLDPGKLEITVVYGEHDRLLLDDRPVDQGIHWSTLSGTHTLRLEILRKRGCVSGENHV